MSSLRDLFLGLKEPVEPVEVLGNTFYLRVLNSQELLSWFASLPEDGQWNDQQRGMLLAKSLCDQSGERLFKDDEWELIVKRDARVVEKLFRRALDMTRLDDTEKKA